MTNEAFIAANRNADVKALALSKIPDGVDVRFCLQQIAGQQVARKKLPSWAATEGIVYPPRLSMEQCSSEQTALYKQQLVQRLLPVERLKMADFTGGFGIDFSFLARLFEEANYVEKNPELCDIARRNFPLLGLKQVRIHNTTSEEFLDEMGNFCFIYLDPSRRDTSGKKVAALSDCTPNLEALQDKLLAHAPCVLAKLSPMLDVQDTIRRLPRANEVHVVSVDGECKEVLVVLSRQKKQTMYHCVNLGAHPHVFTTDDLRSEAELAHQLERYLYEPNASILKAGVQDALCETYHIRKLHPFSHLFISADFIEDFPGRSFIIDDFSGFAKRDLKRLLSDIKMCNLAIRNFPSTVAELRKRLNLGEGGDVYLFATTLFDGSHALLRCRKCDKQHAI